MTLEVQSIGWVGISLFGKAKKKPPTQSQPREIKECVYSYFTSDCHECIKSIASIILCSADGDAVFRELAENVLNLGFVQILYAD